jgi:hypothetical protein
MVLRLSIFNNPDLNRIHSAELSDFNQENSVISAKADIRKVTDEIAQIIYLLWSCLFNTTSKGVLKLAV